MTSEIPAAPKPRTRARDEIDPRFRWDLNEIFDDWDGWQQAYDQLAAKIDRFAAIKGTLADGPAALLEALELEDDIGRISYRVWFFPSLKHDEDQRDNAVNARRQQVQILFAKASQASSWFNPELLQIPRETISGWLDGDERLALYRFAIDDLFRQQEHVLDDQGERLLSFATRLSGAPSDAYAALTTADIDFPKITLDSGEEVTVTHGQYRAILATDRSQDNRRRAFEALYGCYQQHLNTYAALYSGVAERDWFYCQSRDYPATLGAALFGNDIPTSVVETLIATTKQGVEPLRRYHRLRRKVLGLERYQLYDGSVPLVADFDRRYHYGEVLPWIVESVAPLGEDYQRRMRSAIDGGWIDVYENEGKQSGAYSAGIYGVHPYLLLNYNDTIDDVFTLAHELGHALHTLLSHERQPFRYASYTIFVAEVASTLNEALLLELMLARSDDAAERAVLLQHAIDSIVGTYYTQVLFAAWELEAHRLVESGQPLTAERLGELYAGLLAEFYADAVDLDDRYAATWARIPHFFRSPYYVYQYATCFASSARLLEQIHAEREPAVGRYLELLSSGGSDYPMNQLRRAGVDLRDASTVGAVSSQLDRLVDRLEQELAQLAAKH